MGLLLALGTFCWLFAYPVLEVHRVAAEQSQDRISEAKAIAKLHGPEQAARKIGLYLRMPEKLASNKKAAIFLLGRCGKAAVPILVNVLGDENESLVFGARIALISTFSNIDDSSDLADANAELMRALRDPNVRIRRNVAMLLLLDLWEGNTLTYVDALKDPDALVRIYIAGGFGAQLAYSRLGWRDPDIIPVVMPPLLEALGNDPDVRVRIEAARAIGEAETDALPWVSALKAALRDGEERVRWAAAGALTEVRPDTGEQLPVLLTALNKGNKKERAEAARGLGRLGPGAAEAVPHLQKALKDEDGDVRRCSINALGEISSKAAPSVPALIEALRDSQDLIRLSAANALGDIGPAAREAVPSLGDALSDKEPFVRSCAAIALGKMGPAAREAIPALEAALNDKDFVVRREVSRALQRIRGEAPPKTGSDPR